MNRKKSVDLKLKSHSDSCKSSNTSLNINSDLERTERILSLLVSHYQTTECALVFDTPYQLLVATILSAQCTDIMVNKTTPALFTIAPTPGKMVKLSQSKLETIIHATGFYSNKARNILAMSRLLLDQFNGEIPRSMAELIQLPGVGRKTASVVLGVAFGISEGIVVDTHVGRISRRLGWTHWDDATKIEQDLMKIIPQDQWIDFSHRIIHHGRTLCNARKPDCANCFLVELCPYPSSIQ